MDRGAPTGSPVDARTATMSTRFIENFAGDDRFVVDYLVEEVLERQSDDIRDFLLETAVLSRFTGSLCDAVTATTGGGRRSRCSTAPTCSSSPSTIDVAGIAITICSPTCSSPVCSTSGPTGCANCTAGQAIGTTCTARRPRRSSTRSPATCRACRTTHRAGGSDDATEPPGGDVPTLARGSPHRCLRGSSRAHAVAGRRTHGDGRSDRRRDAARPGGTMDRRRVRGHADRVRSGRVRQLGSPSAPSIGRRWRCSPGTSARRSRTPPAPSP